MGAGRGVEIRETSIRVNFTMNGERYRETLDLKPTAANIKYATRLSQEVAQAVRDGSFTFEKFFPDSKHAKKSVDQSFGAMCDVWLETKGRLATKTKTQYRNAAEVWKTLLGSDTPIGKLTHAKVAAKVGSHSWPSAKLLNNYLIVLRGVFYLAERDMKIENPMEGIDNSKHQTPPPDPLSLDEMSAVLSVMSKMDPRVYAYYVFAFATGMRPEEIIALRWDDVDWRSKSIRVERARSAGEEKSLKTYQARDVDLVGMAIDSLSKMDQITGTVKGLKENEGYIFQNPVTGRPWHDERSQRDHYWKPALKEAGVRSRRSYQTRHTYATLSLMAGVNPTYVSRQMGHKSAKMLFQVYAKWIDGADRGRERSKLDGLLSGVR